ncbi:MAG: hypothetical protein LBU65_17080, partial [Planctomycetaceae bacterium]|nr:hypothetical protein [Planctomycetaceae bacterium]
MTFTKGIVWLLFTAVALLLFGGSPFVTWLDNKLGTRILGDLYYEFRVPQITNPFRLGARVDAQQNNVAPLPVSSVTKPDFETTVVRANIPATVSQNNQSSQPQTVAGLSRAEINAQYASSFEPSSNNNVGNVNSVNNQPSSAFRQKATDDELRELEKLAPMVELEGGL